MSEIININEMSDQELDSMNAEDVIKYSSKLWPSRDRVEIESTKSARKSIPIIGHGDSWFDYQPAGFDILDFLQGRDEYEIIDHGVAGDTIENMVYGTKFKKRGYRPSKPRLNEVLEDINDSGAKILLVSGGGNDVAGKELESLLNHASMDPNPIRQGHLDYLVETVFRSAFEELFKRVWALDSSIQIIGHGYGYAVPDGRGVLRILGYNFIGPWLRPAMTKKRILGENQRQMIVNTLIDRLNDLLKDLDQKHPNYHAIDARPILSASDWENELHLKNSAFKRVANLFHEKIQSLISTS